MLRRCLGYWLGQGVLKQEGEDVYVVLEKNRGGQDLQGCYFITKSIIVVILILILILNLP
jgi:hypothetical protein